MARSFQSADAGDRIGWTGRSMSAGADKTLAVWAYIDSMPGSLATIFDVYTGGGVSQPSYFMLNSGGVSCGHWTSAEGDCYATYASAPSTGAWHHFLWTDTGGSARSTAINVYFDGVLQSQLAGANSTGTATGSSAVYTVGGAHWSARHFDGKLAEAAAWQRILSAGEIAALAAGYSPRHFPKDVLFHAPMVRGAQDVVGGSVGTENVTPGTTDHPRVILPKRRRIFSLPSASPATIFPPLSGKIIRAA